MRAFLLFLTLLLCSCSLSHQAFIACKDPLCPYCHGTGKIGLCTTCMGKGVVPCTSYNCDSDTQLCPDCGGSGQKRCGYYVTVTNKKN